ncbi:LacI family DNA-binding transcriptional regulator [Noviherbaspirillum denitrificans]|uniref:Transcriptional regulator n=1 Tax=Noviherbaspirillum denitrificans TaxID=1968433 RepID=A0A254TEK3_9BURK|nr:LacI family DNA-binding transcriptional regulator [Noviherbaspirillum denitrificans]OWW20965.1 transcriptional regulator [Noviherbaspirillum denitrificans]
MPNDSSNPSRGRVRRRATLADVAKAVGVSTMTASRAIGRPELVSEELRGQIEIAIRELGYVPNRAARALASARSHVIAVLIPSLSNAVFTDVLAGVQDAVDAEGYQVLIGNTRYSFAEEEKLVNIHLQSNPDGVLLTGLTQSERVRQMLSAAGIPTVSMMDLSDDPDRYSVGMSQFDAGHTITRHLLVKGYRRIGFIAAQLDERTLKRADGYRHALQQAGLYDSRREVLVSDPSTIALGAELVGRLMARAPDCDAVFCCNDDLAYGAIFQCQRRGIAIPQQLAICGFNDLPASAWMNPSVTTISTPRYRVGFEAATLLKQLICGEQPEQRRIDLGFTLMAREST